MRAIQFTMWPLVAFGMTLTAANGALASGFFLGDHGAKGTGRSNAVTATAKGGYSIHHNPGGLALTEGMEFSLGANLIAPSSEFEGAAGSTKLENKVAATLHAYGAVRLNEWLGVGLGFNTPFGLKLEWPEDSPGADQVREVELRTFFIMPQVSFNLNPWVPGLSVGGGLDLVPADVQLKRDIFFGSTVGNANLGGDAFGVGGRIGVMYQPEWVEGLSFGFTYRSPIELDFEGEGDFDAAQPFRGQLPPDGAMSTTVELPQNVSVGVAYRFLPELEVEFDVNWFDWSSFDRLDIALPGGQALSSVRDWEDVVTYRLGAEYSLRDIGLDLRAGITYDPTPVPVETLDFILPDVDRFEFTVGASYQLPKDFFVDFGLLWIVPRERQTGLVPQQPPVKGDFEVTALVAGLTVGVQLDRPGQAPAMDPAPMSSELPEHQPASETQSAEPTEAAAPAESAGSTEAPVSEGESDPEAASGPTAGEGTPEMAPAPTPPEESAPEAAQPEEAAPSPQ